MRFFPQLTLLFFLFSHIVLIAESEIRMRGLENRVKKLEKNEPSPYHPITPAAGPRVRRGVDFFLMGKFLYWTARLDTLSYAKSGSFTSFDSLPTKGKIHSVDWKWDPGFQVGMGWNFCHGDWDMQIKYTWYYTKSTGRTQDTVIPNFSIFSLPFSVSGARANWDLHYQLGDLEFGRNFFVERHLKLRPFIGIKGTWQKQDYKIRLFNLAITDNPLSYTATSRFDHAIWGLGPRAGLNSSWQFAKWVGLYGDFALSGLWLRYTTEHLTDFRATTAGTPPSTQGFKFKKKLRITKPIIELGLGIRFETYLNCRRLHVLLQFGWETQMWPNQTIYIDLDDNLKRFDLLLHGGIAKLRFDF